MARRVNTRFLVILSAVVVGGGATAFVAREIKNRRNLNPERFVVEGKTMMAEGRWLDAATQLSRAISISKKDPDTWVLFGQAMERVAATEARPEESMQKARGAYRSAVEIDNRHLPALHALLTMYRSEATKRGGGQNMFPQDAIDTAGKILAVQPDDREAKLLRDEAGLRAWQRGVTTDAVKVDAVFNSLEALAAAEPTDPLALDLLTEAYNQRMVDASRANRTDAERKADVRKISDQCATAVERALTDPAKVTPELAVKAVQGITIAAGGAASDPARTKELLGRRTELLAAGVAKVQPTDPAFVELRILQAAQLVQAGDKAGGEKLVKELVDAAPYDPKPRQMLAGLIGADPARRAEAADVLTQPVAPKPGGDGFDVLAAKDAQLENLYLATNIRVETLPGTTEPSARAALKAQIDAALLRFKDLDLRPSALLSLRGKYELYQGDAFSAVKSFNDALSASNQGGADAKDDEVRFHLGRAYMEVRQTGNAKSTFLSIVDRPRFGLPARQSLVQLYLEDNQTREAIEQLDVLDRMIPGNADLQRLRFAAYVKDGRRDEALALYAKLPVTTKIERLTKAQGALSLGDRPAAIALLEDAAKAFPDDAEIPINLAQQYVAAQQPDKAKATVAGALEKSPDNGALKLLQARLAGETQAAIMDDAFAQTSRVTDPFQRELQRSELRRLEGKLDEAMKHLAEADKAKPGDPGVADKRFNILLAQGKFDDAAALVPALVKADQDKAGGLVYKFRLALVQNKLPEAESLGLELTQKLPAFAQSWLCYGQALQAQNKPTEAIEKYNRALERQTSNAEAYRGLIDCYYAVGKPDDALRYIAQARRALPNDNTFREAELNHAQNFGDPTPVLAARKEAVSADPESKGKWQALATAYLKAAQFNAPRVDGKKLADGYLAQARDLLAKAVDKWPAERSFAALYADVALSLDDAPSAEKVLKRFAEQDEWKGKPEAQMMLGELFARTARYEEAEDAFNAALKSSNNAVGVRTRFAGFLAERGKVAGAIELLPADDKDPGVRSQRINLLSGAGKFKEAEEAVKASLVIEPDSLDSQALLASVYLDQGRFEDAAAQSATVIAKDPKNRMALYVRGLVKLRRPDPDPDGAIADLTTVSEMNPRNVDVRIALADAQRQRGNTDAAMNTLAGGLQQNNANKVLRLRLLDLYATNDRANDADRLIAQATTIAPLQADPEWLASEANAYVARGDFDKAAARMKAALAIVPDNGNLQNAYVGLLIRGRNYKAAIAEADKVIAKGDVWWAHQLKAVARKSTNDKAGAVSDLTAALRSAEATGNDDAVSTVIGTWAQQVGYDEAIERLKPRLDKGVRWKLQTASLYLEKKDYAAARSTLDAAMAGYDAASENEQLQLLRFAGSFYLSVLPTEPDKAMAAYEKLLAKTPNDLAALNNVACLLAESVTPPRPEKALEYSTRAYESLRRVGRFDAMIFDTQGWLLVLNNRADDGTEILRSVVNRVPFAEAHYHLAEAYLRLENPYPQEAQRQLVLAQAAYDAAAKTKAVDPALKRRIEDSVAKANEMLKKGATGASTAPAALAN